MLSKDQNQDVGSGATAIQAGGNVTIVGVSATEARAIALDVAKATFFELTGVARETMSSRVEEITEKVISKLERDFPEGLKKATDPDFQHALFTVQKQFGRTGDEDLGDLLIDLLVDRSKQDNRNILQIVLNESLEVAPKLTSAHLSILAVVFLLGYTKNHGLGSYAKLGGYLDDHLLPFVGQLTKNSASYQHLEFTGCGSVQAGERLLEAIFLHHYPALFTNGFESSEFVNRGISIECQSRFFIPCLSDSSKVQVSALDKEVLDGLFQKYQASQDDRGKITLLFEVGQMSHEEIRQKCVKIRPYMDEVFKCWSDSEMKSFFLTSVGMAIGHANVKRLLADEFASLSIWIN
jgi:hypothetical protein